MVAASACAIATRILIVEDNPEHAELLKAILAADDRDSAATTHAGSLQEALEHLAQEQPDVILLDLGLPDSTGLQSLEQIHELVPGAPVIMMSALGDETVVAEALHKGAQDYLVKGSVDRAQLTRAIRYAIERNQAVRELDVVTSQLREANAQLERMAILDPLTELLNRRGLQQALTREIQWAQRHKTEMVAFLLDLDDFKRINDALGHAAGDVVLKEIADRMKSCMRATDYVARIGGDEFIILLPQTTLAQGRQIAEKVRLRISETPVSWSAEAVKVTASVGVVSASARTPSIDVLLPKMHFVLAKSKQTGKDQVCCEGHAAPNGNGHGKLVPVLDALRQGDALRVVKQPIFRLADEQIVGYEFLSRFSDEVFDQPDDFFSICHEADILTLVDHRCLKNCLSSAAGLPLGLRRHFNIFPSTMIALPVLDLRRVFPADAPHGSHCIEISEQQIIGSPRNLVEAAQFLRTAGILIAIDDLGCGHGHASVESLTVLEPDIVKIDKKWVNGVCRDASRLRSLQRLLKLVEAIGAEVIVEGIERREDFEVIKDLGVPYGQGYLWGELV